jgi:hypothetical protein
MKILYAHQIFTSQKYGGISRYFRGKQKLFDLLNKSNSILKLKEQNERLTTLVGKVTAEKEWLAKKLKSLDSKSWADHHLMTKEAK